MSVINVFGLIMMVVIMIPNIVFAVKCKEGFESKWTNHFVEVLEQIGRFGCFGWWSDEAFAVYLAADALLLGLYCLVWMVCFRKNSVFRVLALSILPSALFLFSGILSRSVLLTASALLFAPAHIAISYRNAR